VLELRLLGVKTIEEANEVLPKLPEKHNRKLAVQPKQAESAYMTLDPSVKLEHVFTLANSGNWGTGTHALTKGKFTPSPSLAASVSTPEQRSRCVRRSPEKCSSGTRVRRFW